MAIKDFFAQTEPGRRRYGVATGVGIIAGIMSAFVKWGAEVPLPPRTFSGGRDELIHPIFFYVITWGLILLTPFIPSQSTSSIR